MEVEIPLKKRKHQKKGALKQNVETSLYTLYWGFEKIPFTLYTYVLDKILQNGNTKTDSQFQKSREEFVILCNVTKKKSRKKCSNYSYRDDDVTIYVNFFKNLCEKWLKYVFF